MACFDLNFAIEYNKNSYNCFTKEELDNEIWKPIENFYNYYISNLGRVRHNNKLIKVFVNKGKYKKCSVVLYNNVDKKYVYFIVSRLVAKYFIKDFDETLTIDHIDCNPTNNRVSNLKICTLKENINNDITINKIRNRLTEFNKSFNIKVKRIDKDGNIKIYDSITIAAKENKCDPSKISAICGKKTKIDSKGYTYTPKTCGGYKWEYYG